MNKILLFLFLSPFCFSQKWSISFAERSALVQLFTTTNGENWSTKWDLEKDPRYWYGIKIKKGSVSEINLRGNALKGNFPASISSLPKLEKLDVSSNQLEGELSNSVSSAGQLVRLDISNNRLVGDPASIILPLSQLKEISLGGNQFIFSDIDAFLQNFPNLTILDLSHIGLTAVPQKISTLTKLEALSLSNNTISKNFSHLSTLTGLKELNLSGNQLTKMPMEISMLTQLQSLNLSNNSIPANSAKSLAALKNLEWLSLAQNELNAFPAELAQLQNLIHLNCSDNKISGGFESLISLQNLEQLFLDKNLISGAFPSALLDLKKLQMLSLTGNQLSGTIPDQIPALTFLDNNRFSKQDIKTFLLKEKPMADFTYSPQRYDEPKTVFALPGNSATLPQALSGEEYEFIWFKNLDQKTPITAETYYISKVEEEDFTAYTCEAYYFDILPTELLEISFYREPVNLENGLGTAEVKVDLIVYPNPTTDFINIKTTKLNVEKVFIFDLSGKLIRTENSKIIDVSHLPSATYIISVKTSAGLRSFKFIKI